MNSFTLAKRSFFRKGRNNIIKVLSLGVGLAVGLTLIAKVGFEVNYDDFYPDSDRIYQIQTNFRRGNDPERKYESISGAVAPGMKAEIPEVEAATRFTLIFEDGGLMEMLDAHLAVRFKSIDGEGIRHVYDTLKGMLPEKDIVIVPYSDSMLKLYHGERLFRNSIMIGGIAVLAVRGLFVACACNHSGSGNIQLPKNSNPKPRRIFKK